MIAHYWPPTLDIGEEISLVIIRVKLHIIDISSITYLLGFPLSWDFSNFQVLGLLYLLSPGNFWSRYLQGLWVLWSLVLGPSEGPKPLFWSRSNTQIETLISNTFGRYRNRNRNHQISDLVIYLHRKCGVFFSSKLGPWIQIPSQIIKSFK